MQAIQITHNNVKNIMELPCVYMCQKMESGKYLYRLYSKGSDPVYAGEGNWILETEEGWWVYTEEEWKGITEAIIRMKNDSANHT